MAEESPPRLYLITPQGLEAEDLAQRTATLLTAAPVACVRLDLGQAAEDEWRAAANQLLPVCHDAEVPLLVAEHFRLVEPLGLDGVHLGESQVPIRTVRKALGPDRVIGAYGGSTRHRGMVLAEAGVDYVALGPVGDTGALGAAEPAGDELFQWWAEMIETPVVAEGAVSAAVIARLEPFADFFVVDPQLWSARDPEGALKALEVPLGG